MQGMAWYIRSLIVQCLGRQNNIKLSITTYLTLQNSL